MLHDVTTASALLLFAFLVAAAVAVWLALKLGGVQRDAANEAERIAEQRWQEWRVRDYNLLQQQHKNDLARAQELERAAAQSQIAATQERYQQDVAAMQARYQQDVARAQELAAQVAQNELDEWKARHEQQIRQDAIDRSRAVIVGKVTEHVTPYLPSFHFNPKDARFIGSPIDLVVFDGLDAGDVQRVVFIEIKTGAASLTTRERQIRDAIKSCRVEWHELRSAKSSENGRPPLAVEPFACTGCGTVDATPGLHCGHCGTPTARQISSSG
jgi:predicted Holliday junction resolvase-like endonuclease